MMCGHFRKSFRSWFAALAVFVTCLGVFGGSASAAERQLYLVITRPNGQPYQRLESKIARRELTRLSVPTAYRRVVTRMLESAEGGIEASVEASGMSFNGRTAGGRSFSIEIGGTSDLEYSTLGKHRNSTALVRLSGSGPARWAVQRQERFAEPSLKCVDKDGKRAGSSKGAILPVWFTDR